MKVLLVVREASLPQQKRMHAGILVSLESDPLALRLLHSEHACLVLIHWKCPDCLRDSIINSSVFLRKTTQSPLIVDFFLALIDSCLQIESNKYISKDESELLLAATRFF